MQRIDIIYPDKGTMKFLYPQEMHDNIIQLLLLCNANKMAEKMLLALVAAKENIIVDFTNTELISLGRWLPDENKMEIRKNLSLENLLKTFIFESSNAYNPKFNGIDPSSFASGIDYANYIEESEYDSYVLAYSIFAYGITNADWPMPANMTNYAESLSKEVFMKKSRSVND